MAGGTREKHPAGAFGAPRPGAMRPGGDPGAEAARPPRKARHRRIREAKTRPAGARAALERSCPAPSTEFAMAHSFVPSAQPYGPAGPNQPDLNADAVWQARVDLAACFRMAARYGLEEGICNHFSAIVPG